MTPTGLEPAGEARLFRYADDAVFLFANEDDARRVMAVLPKRFGRFGLTLHPEKTRLVEFRRPDRRSPTRTKPGTFDLLGFTHFWGVARSGKWIVKRKTAKDRFRKALKRLADWCKIHLHDSLETQWRTMSGKLRGHFGYYGIVGNFRAIARFREEARGRWGWHRDRSKFYCCSIGVCP